MKLHIKVKPGSKKDEVTKEADGSFKIKIKEQPIDGKANTYLISFLSKLLALPKLKIAVLEGETNTYKTLEIEATELYVMERLNRAIV